MARGVLPERLRIASLWMGAVAAFGIAEQSHNPSAILEDIPGADWPFESLSVWTFLFAVCGVLCVAAAVSWPRADLQRVAAVVYAAAIWTRSIALLSFYGTDLWGTVATNVLTALLVISSWSWSGEVIRTIDRAARPE